MASAASTAQTSPKRKGGLHISSTMVPTISAVVIFVIMLLAGQGLFGTYLRLGTISDLFIDHAYLIILAVAMTFPVLTGGIDLSIGAMCGFTGVIGVTMLNAGVPWPVAALTMLACGAVSGLIAATLIRQFNMQPFIATLATQFLARGVASIITTESLSMPAGNDFSLLATKITIIDNPKVSNDLFFTPGVVIAVIAVIVGYFILHRTRTGRTIYAIGGSEPSAQLMGLNVNRTVYVIYIVSGVLAALAGLVYCAKTGSAKSTVGTGWELDAVASVVIGGAAITGGSGYVLGSVVGALVRSLLDPLTSDLGVAPEAVTIVVGVMILVFVLLQKLILVISEKRASSKGREDAKPQAAPQVS